MERDDLADLIWPDRLPPAWERDLSAVVSKLRRLLRSASDGARATIKGATGCYELVLPPGSTVDVTEAAGAVDRARAELGHGRLEEARLAAEEAAAVARRPLLPGTSAVWLDERRQWLRGVLVQALAVQVEVAIRRHDPAGVRAANEAVAADPTSEPAYANQMRLYLSLGETAAALETYERYRAAVVDDLGLPAAPELEALFAAARAGSASLPGPAPASHPPSGRVGLLPRPATTFVGRKPDLVAVDAALRQAKIVTITGPAGVGKSRLALEAARRVVGHYRDGVRSCELAHVSHPEVRSQSQPLQARMPWRLLSRAAAVGMQAVEHPARWRSWGISSRLSDPHDPGLAEQAAQWLRCLQGNLEGLDYRPRDSEPRAGADALAGAAVGLPHLLRAAGEPVDLQAARLPRVGGPVASTARRRGSQSRHQTTPFESGSARWAASRTAGTGPDAGPAADHL